MRAKQRHETVFKYLKKGQSFITNELVALGIARSSSRHFINAHVEAGHFQKFKISANETRYTVLSIPDEMIDYTKAKTKVCYDMDLALGRDLLTRAWI